MKTYTIYGTNDTKPFREKYWHPVATASAKSKSEALKLFKEALRRDTSSVNFLVADPESVSHKVKCEH
jgi:hypothetical protein